MRAIVAVFHLPAQTWVSFVRTGYAKQTKWQDKLAWHCYQLQNESVKNSNPFSPKEKAAYQVRSQGLSSARPLERPWNEVGRKRANTTEAQHRFCSMKQQRVLLPPPNSPTGWDTSSSQGYPPLNRRYSFIHLGRETHYELAKFLVSGSNVTWCRDQKSSSASFKPQILSFSPHIFSFSISWGTFLTIKVNQGTLPLFLWPVSLVLYWYHKEKFELNHVSTVLFSPLVNGFVFWKKRCFSAWIEQCVSNLTNCFTITNEFVKCHAG